MYKAYRCKKCNTVFIISDDDMIIMTRQGRYIACPFGHQKIEEVGKYDSLRECMDNHVYVREKGRMRQIK